jgi:rhodanese-related sulfurtransferase
MLNEVLDLEITAAQLSALLKEGSSGVVLLDVREPWEFATAKIEGSAPMPMGDVASRAFQELDPDSHLITICHHGVRSMSVAVWLRQEGFEKTQSLQGGIDAWSREIDPQIPQY